MSDLGATHDHTALEACPVGGERNLTETEVALARGVFGDAIRYDKVTIRRRKWAFFQPRTVTMAPRGHMHFHPKGESYCDDFGLGDFRQRGHFIHEMTHIWQTQQKGDWYLPLHRHPWCRYDYSLKPGWGLEQYGIEQQAEIVKHAFWLRTGVNVGGVGDASAYDLLVKFPGATL